LYRADRLHGNFKQQVVEMSTELTQDKTVPSWQRGLREAYRSVPDLLEAVGLGASDGACAEAQALDFPVLATRAWVAKIKRGDPNDPLLLQVLPQAQEWDADKPGLLDPLNEQAYARSGLLHKYHGRVLWMLTGACAVHCRYCFRRHFPYAAHIKAKDHQKHLDYIASDPSIKEVILSGGDPWLVHDARLEEVLASLEAMPHVTTVRWHTRLPLMLPSRVTPALLALLNGTRLKQVVVLHCNHPQALDALVQSACQRLREAGVTLLNQSVLLAGINDCVSVLQSLSERLFACGILPYYLHVLDPVKGAMHFDVPDAKAQVLMAALAKRLPGYLLPRCVREVPGMPAKTPLAWSHHHATAHA
jgi:L-lysine 2,3-aminomutase